MTTLPPYSLQHYFQQPSCGKSLSMDEWIKKIWYILIYMVYCIYNGILYSHNKLGNSSIYNNMDVPCGNHAKWSKLDRKKNTVWSHLYAESQKIKLIETKDKSVVTRAGEVVGDGLDG